MGLSRNHFQLNSGRSPVRSRLRSFSSRRFNPPFCDLDWPVPVATDNRWRCGRSLVRCGLTRPGDVGVKPSGGPVIRPPPNVARNSRSVSPYWGSRNPSTVKRWGCGEGGVWCCRVGSFWFGFDVSVAAIGRCPDTSLPGGRSRRSKRCDTRSERHSQRSERRNASSAEAAGGASAANVASCPITEVVQIVAGLSQAARDGARQRGSILDYRCR